MIRTADGKDIDDILVLYRAGLDELGDKYQDSLILNKVITSIHLAPCFLLVIDDIICGMAGLTTLVCSPSGQATLTDYMFYIRPEYRKLENFSALINATKDFAVEKSLPLRLQFTTNISEKLRRRLFDMYGFKVISVTGGYNG